MSSFQTAELCAACFDAHV